MVQELQQWHVQTYLKKLVFLKKYHDGGQKGVIFRGRENLNQWKSSHAIETKNRSLDDAINNADVFLGLSAKGALTKEMVKKMAKNPIIFACANPDPEITPEEIEEVRDDAIIATGRSDYPNQVNNLIGVSLYF